MKTAVLTVVLHGSPFMTCHVYEEDGYFQVVNFSGDWEGNRFTSLTSALDEIDTFIQDSTDRPEEE